MDTLITAVAQFESAVDDFNHAVFVNATNPDPEDVPVSTFAKAIVEANVAVALAMTDADVRLASVAATQKLFAGIPERVKAEASEAEIAALRGNARVVSRARCLRCAGTGQFITYVENGVPKGPGGPCYRCSGKGYQTVEDHRRNYGHDNFAPIRIY